MAELDIGKQCSVGDCKQLDFLPLICDGCSQVFCLEHRSRDSHSCSEVSLNKGCVKSTEKTSYLCTYKECRTKEPLPVVCPFCEKHFCLGHRHQSDHECEKLDAAKPRMVATQQLVKEIVESKKAAPANKGRKRAKNSETAAKVALMKLKMHAAGDKSLPQTERVYFQVFLPKGSKEKSQPMFFSCKWSIGKVVDYAASLAYLRNDNNISTAKKLRFCHAVSGITLPVDQTLESWVSNTEYPLYNGGNIILEYLENECKAVEDVSLYIG
ncbi:AN1-type zinc finger protein 1 [Latimeria chalumnae]|uniref:Zinc finger AN1-type containing 1 n=1 Tax=Latimeria chalumnae TaxID=7897 RepID=H3AJF2_LATCH|nr:PREDICTED: AN1-type zinc finger protein 1 [Latimeria chalumnae]|eukprot:XP_006009269.1 PREDICTED: AN1-type zinc finger protein 1 [Latimeria chalumnae]